MHYNNMQSSTTNNPPYFVNVELDLNRTLKKASCNCIGGQGGTCKHIPALIHSINSGQFSTTKTDCLQVWGKPKNIDVYKCGIRVETNYPDAPVSKLAKLAKPYEFSESDYNLISNSPLAMISRAENLSESAKCVARILETLLDNLIFKATQKEIYNVVDYVEDCQKLFSLYNNCNEYKLSADCVDFYNKYVVVCTDQIKNIAFETISQSLSSDWFKFRKIRVSASVAHRICHTRDPEKLASDLIESPSFQSAATSYGLKMEKVCLKMLNETIGKYFKIILLGSVVKRAQPFYICSPDAILINKITHSMQILEIKSPITCKSKPIFDNDTTLSM